MTRRILVTGTEGQVVGSLVERLLRKDPRDRYQSAEAALVDLEAIATGIRAGNPDPAVVIGAHDKRFTLTGPSFVGRTEQMRAFDDELQKARAGAGGLMLVECESGGGKSRLLDEAARVAAQKAFPLSAFAGARSDGLGSGACGSRGGQPRRRVPRRAERA